MTSNWKDNDQITLRKEVVYKRFSLKTIVADILDLFLVNRGLFYTIKALAIAPGASLHAYLGTERERMTPPAKYFFILAGLFYFAYFRFTQAPHVQGYMDELESDGVEEFSRYFQVYFLDQLTIWSALAVFFFAWFSRILFRRHGFYYTEHLIVHVYASAQIAFYQLLLLPAVHYFGQTTYFVIEGGTAVFYTLFLFYYFFREKFITTLWKSMTILILGYLMFFVVVMFFWFTFGFFLGLNQSYSES